MTGKEGQTMPPSKLAHVVFQTNRLQDMRDWYCTVLGGHVIYENPHLSFVTYDEEHHRVAFLDFGPLASRDPNTELQVKSSEPPGLHHVAFTFESMGSFLDNYARLRERGIRPFFCVNHGPTTSMYYRDPDGNRVELQIDNFATAEEGQAWMHSPAFDRNPIGVEYDPEELVKKFKSGVPVAELVARGD
jgi:catechol 2,3-dioxygenase-like lactoylglutathione lyase family enzyme